MLQPRVLDLFRNLDHVVPPYILEILENRDDVTYLFEFLPGDKSGVLYAYANGIKGMKGVASQPVEADWFARNKLWFRKHRMASQSRTPDQKYEAFVSYLSDYRDEVLVDIYRPLVRLVVTNLDTPPKMRIDIGACTDPSLSTSSNLSLF